MPTTSASIVTVRLKPRARLVPLNRSEEGSGRARGRDLYVILRAKTEGNMARSIPLERVEAAARKQIQAAPYRQQKDHASRSFHQEEEDEEEEDEEEEEEEEEDEEEGSLFFSVLSHAVLASAIKRNPENESSAKRLSVYTTLIKIEAGEKQKAITEAAAKRRRRRPKRRRVRE